MLKRVEPRPNGMPNYRADEPRSAWDAILRSLSGVATTSGVVVDGYVKKKPVANGQKSLAVQRATLAKGESGI
jgi:hypothetical protein